MGDRIVIRVIGDESVEVEGRCDGERVLIAQDELRRATGWELTRRGLCSGDTCVTVRDRAALGPDGWVDLPAWGAAVGRPVAADASAAMAVIGHPAAERAAALASLRAPDVRLPAVDGSTVGVYDYSGHKRLVVAFASWCGCRYDLPVWQRLHAQYAERNFMVIGVAVDESAEVVQPWVDAANATFPVLVDADHTFVDAYGIRNVPTVLWIDEDDRIVRPNSAEFSDDQLVDLHGHPSGPHLEALQRWIRHGEKPYGSDAAVRADQWLPDDNQQLARTEYRLAVELWRRARTTDETACAERHFVRAGELAPYDFTIRRGSMPLRGQDPFGAPFFDLYREWEAAGRPYYTEPVPKPA